MFKYTDNALKMIKTLTGNDPESYAINSNLIERFKVVADKDMRKCLILLRI